MSRTASGSALTDFGSHPDTQTESSLIRLRFVQKRCLGKRVVFKISDERRRIEADAAQRRLEDEQVRLGREKLRLDQPATARDIENLVRTLNSGWVGRGFAIGLGIAVLNFLAAIVLFILWTFAGFAS